jgi:hypothetical protein
MLCCCVAYIYIIVVVLCRVVMGMSRGKGTHECLDVITNYISKDKIDFIQVCICSFFSTYMTLLIQDIYVLYVVNNNNVPCAGVLLCYFSV